MSHGCHYDNFERQLKWGGFCTKRIQLRGTKTLSPYRPLACDRCPVFFSPSLLFFSTVSFVSRSSSSSAPSSTLNSFVRLAGQKLLFVNIFRCTSAATHTLFTSCIHPSPSSSSLPWPPSSMLPAPPSPTHILDVLSSTEIHRAVSSVRLSLLFPRFHPMYSPPFRWAR